MRIELKDIKGGLLVQDYDCAVADFPELQTLLEESGAAFSGPIHFHLRLQRVGQLVEVDGLLNAGVSLFCGRCLQPFSEAIADRFSLTFTPRKPDQESVEELELASDELGLIHYQDEVIDLLDPLQEQLIMALPISPLCREDCGGLCPECGQNLNLGRCKCEKKVFNNKFSALAGFKLDKH